MGITSPLTLPAPLPPTPPPLTFDTCSTRLGNSVEIQAGHHFNTHVPKWSGGSNPSSPPYIMAQFKIPRLHWPLQRSTKDEGVGTHPNYNSWNVQFEGHHSTPSEHVLEHGLKRDNSPGYNLQIMEPHTRGPPWSFPSYSALPRATETSFKLTVVSGGDLLSWDRSLFSLWAGSSNGKKAIL